MNQLNVMAKNALATVAVILLLGATTDLAAAPNVGAAGGDLSRSSGWLMSGLSVALGIGLVITLAVCACCDRFNPFSSNTNSQPVERRPSELAPPGESVLAAPYERESVTIEPLPDVGSLRLKSDPWPQAKPIGFNHAVNRGIDSDQWFQSADLYSRSNLQYTKELGTGWFGKAVEGEAKQLSPEERRTKVVVQILKEDANSMERNYFLESARPFRSQQHPNVLRLLTQCLDNQPYLLLFEYCPKDLKSHLIEQRPNCDRLVSNGGLFRMCLDVVSGFRFLHQLEFVINDAAARTCSVSADGVVKVGHYGISISKYKDEYMLVGDTAVPVRWLSPDTVQVGVDGRVSTKAVDSSANVWSVGVLLWEIVEFAKLPYMDLTDEQVVHQVLRGARRLEAPVTPLPQRQQFIEVLNSCWRAHFERPSMQQVHDALASLCRGYIPSAGFDSQWQQMEVQVPPDPVVSTAAAPLERKSSVKFQETAVEESLITDGNQNRILDDLVTVDELKPDRRTMNEIASFTDSERIRCEKREYVLGLSEEELMETESQQLVHFYEFLSMDEISLLEKRHLAARQKKEQETKRQKLLHMDADQLLLMTSDELGEMLLIVDKSEAEQIRLRMQRQTNREKFMNLVRSGNGEAVARLTAEDLETAADCLTEEEMQQLQAKLDAVCAKDASQNEQDFADNLTVEGATAATSTPVHKEEEKPTETAVAPKPKQRLKKKPPLLQIAFVNASNISGSSAFADAPKSSPALKELFNERRSYILNASDDDLARMPMAELESYYENMSTDEIFAFKRRVDDLHVRRLSARGSERRRPLRSQLSAQSESFLSSFQDDGLMDDFEESNAWEARGVLLDDQMERNLILGPSKLQEYQILLTIEEIGDLELRLNLAVEAKKAHLLAMEPSELAQIQPNVLDAYLSWMTDADRDAVRDRLSQPEITETSAEEQSPTRLPEAQFSAALHLTPMPSPESPNDQESLNYVSG